MGDDYDYDLRQAREQLEQAEQDGERFCRQLASKDLEIQRLRQALFGLCGEAEKLLEAEMVHYHDSRTVPALIVGLARSVMDARAALSNPPAQQQDAVVVPRENE